MAVLLRDDGSSPIIAAEPFSADKKKAVYRLQQILMTAQDTGDDSLQVMQSIQDHIENKTRQLDVDRKNLGWNTFVLLRINRLLRTKYIIAVAVGAFNYPGVLLFCIRS